MAPSLNIISADGASEPLRPDDSPTEPMDFPDLTRSSARPAYHRSQSSQSGLPSIHPFPSPGLRFSTSRSPSPADVGQTGYFGRTRQRDSYASLSPDDGFPDITPRVSGDRRSFGTYGTEFSQFPHDMHTRLLAEKRAGEIAQWKVHWTTPFLMGGLWLAGFIGAVAHHGFYQSLDGKPATNQLLMFRIGTALAFFVRAMFVASTIFSYRQRIWVTFRHKPLTLGAIDALFSATEDLFGFGNLEMWRNAKIAVAMAITVWLIPFASVLSPAALTTGIKPFIYETTCPTVSTLNFTLESIYDFRKRELYPGFSLSFYNTTDVNATKPGWFDYYDQPSKNARRLTTTSAYLRRPAVANEETYKACGGGWNCTYMIEFKGPGYKCEQLANTTNPNSDKLIAAGSPLNMSSMAPLSNLIYSARVDAGDYADPQVPTNEQGEPLDSSSALNLGVFKTEPLLWIGYTVQTGKPWPSGSKYASDNRWSAGVVESHIMRCEHYEVNYNINMSFIEGVQSAKFVRRDFLSPIVNTTIQWSSTTGDTGIPESNWVRPETDPLKYKLTAAYHVLGAMARAFLRGSIESSTSYILTRSDISETRLTEGRTAYPVPNLDTELQSFYEDMLLSLLSEPNMVIAANASVPCTKTKSMIVHLYRAQGLWIGYAIVTFFSFVSLIIGSLSLYTNGVSSDTLFSRIMVTTRNPTLDQLSIGACLGSDPFPKDLERTKLRFGVLGSRSLDMPFDDVTLHDRVEHVGFGTIEEVTPLRKGGKYA